MPERRLVYNWVATEAEKEQAEREALEQHDIDTADPLVDPRSEAAQVKHKRMGILGELVQCNRNGWKRARTPDQISLPYDAIDQDGKKIEIKTRSMWKREIRVSPECDYAALLFYWKDESGDEHFEPIRIFQRSQLRHLPDYDCDGIFLKSEFWKKLLRDAGVPERFVR